MSEFTFSNKLALERRAATLEARESSVVARLERMYGRKQTAKRLAKIERAVDRLEDIREKQQAVADELTNYAEASGTPDAYAFGGFAYDTLTTVSGRVFDWGQASFTVTDSPTDDGFTVGDALTVRASGTKPFAGGSVTFKTLTGDTEGDVTTFEFGSSNLGEMAKSFNSLTFKILDDEKNTIFSSEVIDVTNIA